VKTYDPTTAHLLRFSASGSRRRGLRTGRAGEHKGTTLQDGDHTFARHQQVVMPLDQSNQEA
jgi:hypothetical protein